MKYKYIKSYNRVFIINILFIVVMQDEIDTYYPSLVWNMYVLLAGSGDKNSNLNILR